MIDLGAAQVKIKLDANEAKTGLESFKSSLGDGLATVAKVGTVAITAAAAGISALTKNAVANYAEYEQLVGGVEKLFGDSSNTIQEYAQNAFKNQQMSANTYMETVTGFSASLIASLDGDTTKAAETANMAITDMADNANVFGTNIQSIQNAYQGFAKQNYTMLDNLKLGYGGTKEEMQRLLADAEKLSGVKYDISNLNDVYTAIHVIQEEMSIAGATQKEAASTIEGSINMTKSAWDNLMTGLADDNADMDELLDNLVQSATNAFDNIMPRIEQVLVSIGGLVEKVVPILTESIPNVITQVLPTLLQAAVDLVNGLIQGILQCMPTIISTGIDVIMQLIMSILSMLPQIIKAGFQIVIGLINGITEMMPQLIPTIIEIIRLVGTTIIENLPLLIEACLNLIMSLCQYLIDNIDQVIETTVYLVQTLVDTIIANLPMILEAAIRIIAELVIGIITHLPQILEATLKIIATIIAGIIQCLPQILEKGAKLVLVIIDGIVSKFAELKKNGTSIVDTVKNGIMEKINQARTWGQDLVKNFIQGLKDMWNDLKSTVSDLADTVSDFLGFSEPELGPLSDFHTYAPDMMDLYAKGIRENSHKITDALSEIEVPDNSYLVDSDVYMRSNLQTAAVGSASVFGEAASIVVNNYSPISLNEAETARLYRKTQRELALGF